MSAARSREPKKRNRGTESDSGTSPRADKAVPGAKSQQPDDLVIDKPVSKGASEVDSPSAHDASGRPSRLRKRRLFTDGEDAASTGSGAGQAAGAEASAAAGVVAASS